MRQISPLNSPLLRHESVPGSRDLNECVYKNDIDGARTCLHDDKMAWNTKNKNGLTPLMEAASLSRLEILDLLLLAKCDVNVTDENGNTSLHLAVEEGNTEVVRKLICSGRCVVDAKNSTGETALMKAAFYDYSDMVRIMMTDGEADSDVRHNSGQTALHIALREDSQATVDLLLKHGCDVNVLDNLGQSALYVSIHSPFSRTLDSAKKLLAADYDIAVDRFWLLHEEKHNLFYQDDDFYACLRHTLTGNPNGALRELSTYRQSSTDSEKSDSRHSTSPVTSPLSPSSMPFAMSPLLKQKVMSSTAQSFPSVPLNNMALSGLNSSHSSPARSRRNDFVKSQSFEQTRTRTPLRPPLTSSFSSDSDASPVGSPALHHRKVSQNNTTFSRQFISSQNNSIKAEWAISFPTKKAFHLRTDDEKAFSAPNSPMMIRHRNLSERRHHSGSHDDLQGRKLSLPAKATVKFCTEIQILGESRLK